MSLGIQKTTGACSVVCSHRRSGNMCCFTVLEPSPGTWRRKQGCSNEEASSVMFPMFHPFILTFYVFILLPFYPAGASRSPTLEAAAWGLIRSSADTIHSLFLLLLLLCTSWEGQGRNCSGRLGRCHGGNAGRIRFPRDLCLTTCMDLGTCFMAEKAKRVGIGSRNGGNGWMDGAKGGQKG